MKAYAYLIKAMTNLHVGSGDSGYGAVDKLVQRDPATQYPTIFGQSLKGALREYFEETLGLGKADAQLVIPAFGAPVKRPATVDPSQGELSFLSADLLAIPIPDEDPTDPNAYDLQGSQDQLSAFVQKANAFAAGIKEDNLKKLLGCKSWDNEAFKTAARQVPVLARNYLENGISENLWYEEFVPHQSVFGFLILGSDDTLLKAFHAKINEQIIQVGANATVGYGYCTFNKIP